MDCINHVISNQDLITFSKSASISDFMPPRLKYLPMVLHIFIYDSHNGLILQFLKEKKLYYKLNFSQAYYSYDRRRTVEKRVK